MSTDRSEEDTVAYVIENGIAWVSFNRPEKRNCMSPKLNRQMMRVLDKLEFDESVGVLVLTGEGAAWSAGMDLKEYFRETEAQGLAGTRKAQREAYGWWRRLRWYQKPTIAMVNGWCFGGGYGPLYACDLAFAASDAQFGLSEINWGILPGGGATKVATNLMSMATSCSSENSAVVVDAVYDDFIAALARAGGAFYADEAALVSKLWPDGHLNRSVIAQDADKMIAALDVGVAAGTEFLVVPTSGIVSDHPLSGEKLSRVLALYRASDFDAAVDVARSIQVYQGAGHSVGLHSALDARAHTLATAIPTSRIIVNQAHTFATGGSFTNGMPFSLSMGCGTWGGNSVNENVNYRHFLQSTKIIREIPSREPKVEDIFDGYWRLAGR